VLPRIFIAPEPRAAADIFTDDDLDRLRAIGDVVLVDHGVTDADIERDALDAQIVMGQFDLPRERLDRMPNLRAVFNVEGNFLGNIDYAECFRRGIRVLSTSPVFAEPVAEATLGMVIDLARNVTSADRRFRDGTEAYGLDANVDSFTLYDAEVGFVGLGDLGRAMLPLFAPFRCTVRAYDPWLPADYLASLGVRAATLDEVLRTSRVVIVVAGVTAANEGFLGREAFTTMRPGAAFVLVSRAGVVDFDAMLDAAASGAIRVATDVFPSEPLARDHRARSTPNVLLSPHQAGGLRGALSQIGKRAVADAELVVRGLPPVMCKVAQQETVGLARSKPIAKS